MRSSLLLVLSVLPVILLGLPFVDQIALANSLEVGRDEDPETWGCAGCTQENRPIYSYFIEQDVQSIKAEVSVYPQQTVLAFRYTANLKNIWQDILFAFQVQDEHSCIGCKVQREYEKMWNAIREETIEGLKRTPVTSRLVITGISLGGGLAELSFVDIQASGLFKNVQVTTWGAPRVGNAKWVNWLNQLTETRRFYIKSDPIAALPVCLGILCSYKQPLRAIRCNTKSGACKCQALDKLTSKAEMLEAVTQIARESANALFTQKEDFEGILDHIYGYKKLYDCTLSQ